jgi:AAA domain
MLNRNLLPPFEDLLSRAATGDDLAGVKFRVSWLRQPGQAGVLRLSAKNGPLEGAPAKVLEDEVKIIELTAENVKRLKVVEITPKSGLNQITGRNGHGKTSVLDSIWYLLGGKDKIPSVPIRSGEESARIRAVLGDGKPELVVERKFNATGTTSIVVRNAADAAPGTPDRKLPTFNSPQEMLDALVGNLSFDPLAFKAMKPREQYELLMSIADLGVDLEAMEAASKADVLRRTDINRDAKSLRARADGIVVSPEAANGPIDESALIDQMQTAAKHNSDIEAAKAARERKQASANERKAAGIRCREIAAANRDRVLQQVAELEKRIAAIKSEGEAMACSADDDASAALKAAAVLEAEIDNAAAPPKPIDVTQIRATLDAAKRINQAVEQKRRRDELASQAAEIEAQSEALTKQIAAREKQKTDALKAAKMPVLGLEPKAGAVYLNGLPFDQASDAEQLRTGVAIAMAANPKLRVLRIRDGSLLDEDGIAMLAELAKDQDYQIWMERVDSTGKIGIVMEDGQVASVDGVKTEPPAPVNTSESTPNKRSKKSGGFTADATEIADMFSARLSDEIGD